MSTKQTVKKTESFDKTILADGDANVAPDTIAEPTNRDVHSVYWILREKFGFDHIGAMLETYLLLRNDHGLKVKGYQDLKRPDVVKYIKSSKDQTELQAQMLSVHDENENDESPPDELQELMEDFGDKRRS